MSVGDGGDIPMTRVLIVEDEFLIRLMLSESLTDEGYDVAEASSGEQALGILADDPSAVDLVLTDIQLGAAMNGYELARQLRELAAELPIIFMTGRPEVAKERMTGRDRFVAKPYLPSEICSVARELLAGG